MKNYVIKDVKVKNARIDKEYDTINATIDCSFYKGNKIRHYETELDLYLENGIEDTCETYGYAKKGCAKTIAERYVWLGFDYINESSAEKETELKELSSMIIGLNMLNNWAHYQGPDENEIKGEMEDNNLEDLIDDVDKYFEF